MIDLGLLREQPEKVMGQIKRKDPQFPIEELAELDKKTRALMHEVEALRAQKNELAKAAQKGISDEIRMQSKSIGGQLKEKEAELEVLHKKFNDLYLLCPNIPFDDIPDGGKEANKVIKTWGQKPTFSFPVKNHEQIGIQNGWFDFEAAARMAGSNFVLYKNGGVDLVYGLAMLMYGHNKKSGYSPVLPPYLLNERALEGASNFPRFKEDVYALEKDGLYLTPTSEVNLSNLYRDTIFAFDQLPVRMTAWTSCFRREAGGYGSTERGLIRIHQFEKVELYTLCKPEEAESEHQRMLTCAEEILQKLGLHYRISLLAAQDCSFASAKTYDIEVWMPGQGEYKEVSSVSNCTDFQARRCGIRYRKGTHDKTHYAYTLNASSLALPRVMVALLETYQKEDGTVELPEAVKSVTLHF